MSNENTRKAIAQACNVTSQGWAVDIASAIEQSPQELLNAMADDGILDSWVDEGDTGRRVYIVTPRHVHLWRAVSINPVDSYLIVRCSTCSQRTTVPTLLPIEVPE